MTLILPSSTNPVPADKPRLHALIIGVADYPHLLVEGPRKKKQADMTFGLKQVRSPKPSALALATWFAETYNNPDVPLGSIELWASPDVTWPGANGMPQMVTEPTLAAIRAATSRWFERCGEKPGNIAVFYFCGHGLMDRGFQFLLPQDYGDPDAGSQWENCIEFDGFRINMRRCGARTQLFFVDACSDRPDALDKNPARGHVLIDGDTTAPQPDTLVVCNAAAPGRKVDVPAETELTCFTEALLKCLNGSAAQNTDSALGWVVHTDTLLGQLSSMTCRLGDRYKVAQAPAPSGWGPPVPLHRMETPLVPTEIDCSPHARDESEIKLVQALRNPRFSARREPRPWHGDLEAGMWQLEMNFQKFDTVNAELDVRPPYKKEIVEIL